MPLPWNAPSAPATPRRILVDPLNNWRRHREDWRNPTARRAAVDPYSSAPRFDGWRDLTPAAALAALPAEYEPLPTVAPTAWLLTTGWKRHGLLATRERPGPEAS